MSSVPASILYFQRDQLLISYRPSSAALLTTSNIVRGLQQRLDRAFASGQTSVRIRISGRNTATFRTPNGRGATQAAVLRLSVSPPNFVISGGRILSPNENEPGGYIIGGRGGAVQITGAGPNWMTGGAPIQITGGGPGSSPLPQSGGTMAADFDINRSYPEADGAFTVPNDILIFVLDTAPALSLTGARHIANNAGTMANPLVTRLIGKTAALRFDPQNYLSGSPTNSPDFLPAPVCVINGQTVLPASPAHSDESDHGLYVAGIVEMLTQKPGGITLMRTLNRFGVGDSYALMWALGAITRIVRKRPLDKREHLVPILANLSLVLNFPDLIPIVQGDLSQFDAATVKNLSAADRSYLTTWARLRLFSDTENDTRGQPDAPIVESLRALYQQRILCVAAAGNDSKTENHLPTRYPAAYRSFSPAGGLSFAVFSAASISQSLTPSSFSNRGDSANLDTTQPTHGVGVWGGEVDALAGCDPLRKPVEGWLSAGIQKNINLYAEGNPNAPADVRRNADGWLTWAGTSFATPALTAWVARYLAAQLRLTGFVDADLASVFNGLMTTAANIGGSSELGVNYLSVTQSGRATSSASADLEKLVRRAGFGAPAKMLADLAPLSRDAQLDKLTALPPLNLNGMETTLDGWLAAMLTTRDPLREKLALFWHGLFAISQSDDGENLYAWQWLISVYRELSVGFFTPLLQSVIFSHAALAHFDAVNFWDGAESPHYARELLDRLWGGAYTEADVAAVAAALRARRDPQDRYWIASTEGVSVLLTRAAATHIARQMWRFLAGMGDDPAPAVLARLAAIYEQSDFHTQTLARAILASPEFTGIGGIKSPLDLAIGALREQGQTALPADLPLRLAAMGQDVAAPPVEGWPTGARWLKPELVRARLDFAPAASADYQRI